MGRGITVSPKYGVNPMIPTCFYCNKEKNQIVLMGRLPGDVEAPRHAVVDKEPCNECKKWMEQGIIFISVRDGETDFENPYRTGKWCVIKEEAVKEFGITPPKLMESILKKRVCFVPDETWHYMGLPEGETK